MSSVTVGQRLRSLTSKALNLRALIGAGRILAHVRDLVFEEENYPSRVSDHLESRGFVIRRLDRTLLRPLLAEPRSVLRSGQEGANMLATRDIDRATHRYETVGWKCLRSRSGSAVGGGRSGAHRREPVPTGSPTQEPLLRRLRLTSVPPLADGDRMSVSATARRSCDPRRAFSSNFRRRSKNEARSEIQSSAERMKGSAGSR